MDKHLNTLIPLDIGVLSDYIFRTVIRIAQKYEISDSLIKLYNDIIISESCKNLSILGHKAILDSLTKEDDYSKEMVFTEFESDYLIVEFIKERIDQCVNETIHEISEGKRCIELSKQILDPENNPNRINYLIIFNTSGLSNNCIGFDSSSLFGSTLALKPFELQCIAINESGTEDFIPRFSIDYGNINAPTMIIAHPLDAVQNYKKGGFSFYRDDVDIRKATIHFDYGFSTEYIAQALIKNRKITVPYYKRGLFVEVLEIDRIRKIYALPCYARIEKCVIIKNFYIWLVSQEIKTGIEDTVLTVVIDILSYWIGESIL